MSQGIHLKNIYAGLSNTTLTENEFDLGYGAVLSSTYAHLMAPFLMAFKQAEPNKPHPGPWKATRGGLYFDITAQLYVPTTLSKHNGFEAATLLVALMRLWINPAITYSVLSDHPFKEILNTPDEEIQLIPAEVMPRHFQLATREGGEVTPQSIEWVRKHWMTALELSKSSPEFKFALDSLDAGQFILSTGLVMVSLWSALEALFSPSTTELKFRVSSLIASYLEEPGAARAAKQKEVAKLYDKRSTAAHGKPNHQSDDLLASFHLLRAVMIKMIEAGKVPTKAELDGILFGVAG